MLFVSIVSIGYLNSIQSLTNNWDRTPRYPLYIQVEEKEISDYDKKYDTTSIHLSHKKNDNYSLIKESRKNLQNSFNESFITLNNIDGTALWSMKVINQIGVEREFFTSSKGITVIRYYDDMNSIVWVDDQGEILNRMEFQNNLSTEPKSIKNGEIWIIQRIPGLYEYIPEPNVNSSLIFCDSRGNELNRINLKYLELNDEMAISESENYLMVYCHDGILDPTIKRQYQSYLIKHDGTIIKEYKGKALGYGGDFSENEDIYVSRGKRDYIIDVTSGEIITSFEAHGRTVVANKETGIIAALDFGELRVINYKTKKLLFYKKFDVYPRPEYVEITGDGKKVIVVTKDHLYTFRMKE